MLKSLSKLFDTNQRELDRIQPLVQTINSYETKFKKFKTKDFPEKTAKFKLRLTRGETLDDLLPEAFALVRQASVLTLGLRHFDVQLIAGVAFHKGMVAEQKTGEGPILKGPHWQRCPPRYRQRLLGPTRRRLECSSLQSPRFVSWCYHPL